MTTVRLALLDRDGTLNRKAPEGEYVTSPAELQLLPGAAEAVRRLNDAQIKVAVVTNQRCVARGLRSPAGLEEVHAALGQQLEEVAGAHLDAVYVCPHEGGQCACRKPAPGMLVRAAANLKITPAATVVIGDADSDVEAGRRFGAQTIQLTRRNSAADHTAPTLLAAVQTLIG